MEYGAFLILFSVTDVSISWSRQTDFSCFLPNTSLFLSLCFLLISILMNVIKIY